MPTNRIPARCYTVTDALLIINRRVAKKTYRPFATQQQHALLCFTINSQYFTGRRSTRQRCWREKTRTWRHGIAAYCRLENKVSLGFVEGLNNKIRVIQRRAYGLRNEEYLRLKILTCMLPAL